MTNNTNITTMKMYARLKTLEFYHGPEMAGWHEVIKVQHYRFPSGMRECVVFGNGKAHKVDRCEIVYVFNK